MSQFPSEDQLEDSDMPELSEDGGNSPGSTKWKTNNLNLARENARLRKDIQKYRTVLNEYTYRYNNLEMAWRRRGETVSKVDIISRLLGNQIMKLVDTLSELRSTCQLELQAPLELASDQMPRLRHTMPGRSEKTTLSLNAKSQLVNHVNPMISGHPIIKPTITLQRLNLRNVPRMPQGEEMEENIEEVEEVDLTATVGNSSDSSDEDDVVEVTSSPRRISATSLPSTCQNIVLPVAEVPLERLSMSRISGRVSEMNRKRVKNLNSRATTLDRSICSPIDPILEPNGNTCNTRRNSSPTTNRTSNRIEPGHHILELDSPSSISVRKYPPSSQARSSVERSNDLNGEVEKCRLVVALKDVGSKLHNGILSSIEQLEEGKVKTGASAHPLSKDGSSCVSEDSQINVIATSGEDNMELNFTEIGSMDYSAMPLDNDNVEGSLSSSTQEFLNKLREEDPLEGPSWRYENVTSPTRRKRHRSKPGSPMPPKKDNESADSSDTVALSSPKKQSSNSPKSPSKQRKLKTETSNCKDDVHVENMDLTECVISFNINDKVTPNSGGKPGEPVSCSPSNVSLVSASSEVSGESPAIETHITKKKRKLFLNTTNNSIELDKFNSSHKSTTRRSSPHARRSIVRKQAKCCIPEIKKKKTKKSITKKIVRKKSAPELRKVQTETVEKQTRVSENPNGRARRRAAPVSLKEPTLNGKLRRE